MDLITVITIFVLCSFMQCSNQTKYKKNKKCTSGTLQGILKTEHKHQLQLIISDTIIYKEMLLDCDWSVSVQLIPNRSAKICNKSAQICKMNAKIILGKCVLVSNGNIIIHMSNFWPGTVEKN